MRSLTRLGLHSCCYSFAGPVLSMRFVSSSLPLPTPSYSLDFWRSDPRLFLFYVCDLKHAMAFPPVVSPLGSLSSFLSL